MFVFQWLEFCALPEYRFILLFKYLCLKSSFFERGQYKNFPTTMACMLVSAIPQAGSRGTL